MRCERRLEHGGRCSPLATTVSALVSDERCLTATQQKTAASIRCSSEDALREGEERGGGAGKGGGGGGGDGTVDMLQEKRCFLHFFQVELDQGKRIKPQKITGRRLA